MDSDGDGLVDMHEYMQAVVDELDRSGEQDRERRQEALRVALGLYDRCDLDGDDALCRQEVEFARTLSALVQKPSENTDGIGLLDELSRKSQGRFDAWDTDGDGSVDWDEFWAARRSSEFMEGWSNSAFKNPTIAEWVRAVFDRADVSGDAKLNERELHFATLLLNGVATRQLSDAIVQEVDANQDGMLSLVEVQSVSVKGRSYELLQESFSVVDRDGDGLLIEEEILDLAELVVLKRS